MKNRTQITEEDLLVTEALIAESYGRLKKSVIQAPHKALGSVGGTVKRHPFAAAGLAIVGGIGAYMIATRMASQHAEARQKKEQHPPDLVKELVLILLPLAAPQIAMYVQKYLSGLMHSSKNR